MTKLLSSSAVTFVLVYIERSNSIRAHYNYKCHVFKWHVFPTHCACAWQLINWGVLVGLYCRRITHVNNTEQQISTRWGLGFWCESIFQNNWPVCQSVSQVSQSVSHAFYPSEAIIMRTCFIDSCLVHKLSSSSPWIRKKVPKRNHKRTDNSGYV